MDVQDFLKNYVLTTYDLADPSVRIIKGVLAKYMDRGEVLDLGCGPVIPTIGAFLPNAESITGLDVLPELPEFLARYRSDGELRSQLLKIISATAGESERTESEVTLIENVLRRVTIKTGDVRTFHEQWADAFDGVLQIGCFGTLASVEEFLRCTSYAARYLKQCGRLFMITWTQSSYKSRPHGFNSELSTLINLELYQKALTSAGLRTIELERSTNVSETSKERGYDAIVYAVAERI